MSTNRPIKQTSVFHTNRGRKAKAVLVALSVAALAMTLWNGRETDNSASTNVQRQQQAADAEPSGAARATPPKVAAAVANPEKPYSGVNDAEDADSGSGSGAPSSTAPENPAQYQGMLSVAQSAAVSFGTYSYRSTPEQWVATISGLDPSLRKVLLKSAQQQSWPQIKAQRVTADASLVGESPDVVYYRAKAGKAQVVVSLSQKATASKGKRTLGKSVAVTLTRQGGEPEEGSDAAPSSPTDEPDGSEPAWLVTAIKSN